MIRLNLASGTDIKPDWINMDVVPFWSVINKGCEIVWDARKDKLPFPNNSVDEVRSGELLIHIPPQFHVAVLQEIFRVLKPGSTFLYNDIDMGLAMQKWIKDPTDKGLQAIIWGENQEALLEFDTHYAGFTPDSLKKLLTQTGFVNLKSVKVHGEATWYELTYLCQKPAA